MMFNPLYISDSFLQIVTQLFITSLFIWMIYQSVEENKKNILWLSAIFGVLTLIYVYDTFYSILFIIIYFCFIIVLNQRKQIGLILILFLGYYFINHRLPIFLPKGQETLYFVMLKLIASSCYFAIYQVYFQFTKYREKCKVLFIYQLLVFLTCIGTSLLLLSQVTNDSIRVIVFTPVFVMSVAYAVLSILFYYFIDYQNMQEIKNIQDIKNNMINKQYSSLKQKYEDISILKHDIKNHLQTLLILSEKDPQKVNEYLTRYLSQMNEYSLFFKSDDQMLEIVINEKYLESQEFGISFEIENDAIHMTFIDDLDIVTIFCNLLDNAIEANQTVTDKRYIKMKIYEKNHYVMIQVINPFSHEIIRKKDQFISTKDNHMGMGLRSVQKTIHKYCGILTCEDKNQEFKVTVFIPVKQ